MICAKKTFTKKMASGHDFARAAGLQQILAALAPEVLRVY
jgi:hypothetical protein